MNKNIIRKLVLLVFVWEVVAYDVTLMATCNTCPLGCSQCSGTTCSSCLDGYSFISTNSTCQKLPCTISGCALCNSQGSCLSCTDPYSLYSSQTNTCAPSCSLDHCSKCKAGSQICEQCSSGYSIDSWDGSCRLQQISNCLKVHDWRNQQWQCQVCSTNYRPTPDQLQCIYLSCPTINNCLTCSNSLVCEACRLGYSVVSSACQINTCTAPHCLYCASGSSSNCIKCQYGYILSGSTCVEETCEMENCLKCKKGSSFCDICQPPYVYNVWSHGCEIVSTSPQPQNCLTMTRIGRYFTCVECQVGYVFENSDQVKCIKNCPSNCQTCNDASICTACNNGYQLSGGSCTALPCSVSGCSLCNSTGQCLICSDPYSIFSSSSGICSPGCSLPHCKTCLAGSSICLQCLSGYALYTWNNTCSLSLILRCIEYHDWKGYDFYCSRCQLGYKPALDQLSCIQSLCSSIANCQYCPNSTVCSTCSPGYSSSGSVCVSNSCTVQNCLLCNKAGECIKSNSAHYVVGNTMNPIPCTLERCSNCKLGSSFCDTCSEGYKYDDWTNKCEGQQTPDSNNLKYLAFLVIVVVIVAVVIIVKCLKKKNNIDQGEQGNSEQVIKQDEPIIDFNGNLKKEEQGDVFGTGVSALQVNNTESKKHHQKLPPLKLPHERKNSDNQLQTPLPQSPINIHKQELANDESIN